MFSEYWNMLAKTLLVISGFRQRLSFLTENVLGVFMKIFLHCMYYILTNAMVYFFALKNSKLEIFV